MGYDVSFHPVDVRLIQDELIPFVLGQRSIDDRFAAAGRAARNRFLANAWGLAASRYHSDALFPPEPQGKPSFFANIFRKRAASEKPERMAFDFEPDLYVWGRPFFITSGKPSEVSAAIDAYLGADVAEVDALASRMLDLLAPGLSTAVQPDHEEGIPSDDQFRESESTRLVLFARAMEALRDGRPFELPDGDRVPAADLFVSDFALSVISFAAALRPGWMGRGYVWPTRLLSDAGLTVDVFEPATKLFEPLTAAEPSIALAFEPTIEENYTLGGYVPPESVPAALDIFEQNVDRIVAQARRDGWENDARLALQKITEALSDAKLRNFGFLEASEIYSGPLGMMN